MRSLALAWRSGSGWWARLFALAASLAAPWPVPAQHPFVQNGTAGFVISDIRFALAEDAEKTGVCSKGMSLNPAEIYAKTPQGKRKKGESDEEYTHRLDAGAAEVSTAPDGRNLCLNPEAGKPGPYFHTVDASNIQADGIDLDGAASGTDSPSSGGTCSHQDFIGLHDEQGIDNQFYRVVGCSRSWQSSGGATLAENIQYRCGFLHYAYLLAWCYSSPVPLRPVDRH